jgi:putative FmdB family regulatory protein
MPVYTYQCNKCARRFERSFTYAEVASDIIGKRIVTCSACKSNAQRVMNPTPPPAIYKGEGFTLKKKE